MKQELSKEMREWLSKCGKKGNKAMREKHSDKLTGWVKKKRKKK
jgi:hypothetical protein